MQFLNLCSVTVVPLDITGGYVGECSHQERCADVRWGPILGGVDKVPSYYGLFCKQDHQVELGDGTDDYGNIW
jgi:hypothetical protein